MILLTELPWVDCTKFWMEIQSVPLYLEFFSAKFLQTEKLQK